MVSLILGTAGFLLYFFYDINSITIQSKLLHKAFGIGTALLAAATLSDGWIAWKSGAFSGPLDILWSILGTAAFGALIYSLFFALPFKETYTEQESVRHVYDGGVYALCRHPGILCFFAMFLFWGMAALPSDLLGHGMIFSAMNLAYAWFQDRITFPKIFCDYGDYRRQVPFLIPTGNSIRQARATWCSAASEEDPS